MTAAVLAGDHLSNGDHLSLVPGEPSDGGHSPSDVQRHPAPVTSLPVDHMRLEDQEPGVNGQPSPPSEAIAFSDPIRPPPRTEDVLLLIYADALDDFERTRIANENRLRSLRQVKGMEDTPEAARMEGVLDALAGLEHKVTLDLQRAMRKHPLGPWVKRTVGVGEKQGARLIAAIGDPAERCTVSQLWAYCGLHVWHVDQAALDTHNAHANVPSSRPGHDRCENQASPAGVAPRHMKGQKANWNSTAKMRAFLVAESCMKQRTSPYRAVYDAGREKYAEAKHEVPCARCGPKGKPAPVGSDLSDGHKHARALRLVMKAVLRDLWVEARRVREASA